MAAWLVLFAAASGEQPRWPLLIMIAVGIAVLRWRRAIGRGIGDLYGTEFPRNPDPAPSRAKKDMARMFWSFGMLVIGVFCIVVPLAVLVGI